MCKTSQETRHDAHDDEALVEPLFWRPTKPTREQREAWQRILAELHALREEHEAVERHMDGQYRIPDDMTEAELFAAHDAAEKVRAR